MIEYAILIVMVTFAIGFAWLWFIEQKKKRKRKEALQQKEIEQQRASGIRRHCTSCKRLLGHRNPHERVAVDHVGRATTRAGPHDQADRDARDHPVPYKGYIRTRRGEPKPRARIAGQNVCLMQRNFARF